MEMRNLALAFGCSVVILAGEDPLEAPQDLKAFARQVSLSGRSNVQKLQLLITAIHKPAEEGGLGIQYDNAHTRTVAEAWRERKANCLSLTALYVACAQSLGIKAEFADAQNTQRWRRVGSVIRFERHVVALIRDPPNADLVADFLPQLRKRTGRYLVTVLPERRMQGLFRSNRAVELMEAGEIQAALGMVDESVRIDPKSSVGWNTRGVILRSLGRRDEAEVAFRRALAEDPVDISPLGNLESLFLEQGRTEEAISLREKSAGLRQRDPFFHAFLAEEALGLGSLDEAERCIRSAIRLLTFESDFHLVLARILIQKGQLAQAIQEIEEARKWATPGERERYDAKLQLLKRQLAPPAP